MEGPDFIGIGAHKAGSSWLWKQLQQHPDVWMPPVKEIHFFDNQNNRIVEGTSRLKHRLTTSKGRGKGKKLFISALKKLQFKKAFWLYKFYTGKQTDKWYLSLFKGNNTKIKGDITPSYSFLPKEKISHINRLFPDAKIIFLMRNPIERAWSHIRFDYTQGWIERLDDIEKIKAFIDADVQTQRGNYVSIIENWESVYPKKQIFYGFYDQILDNPKDLIADILTFLGVPNKDYKFPLNEIVNKSYEKDMPQEIIRYLTLKYMPMMEELAERFGSYPGKWMEEIKTN